MRFIMVLFSAALIATVSTSAEARPHHRHHKVRSIAAATIITCDQQGCHGDRVISKPRQEVSNDVVYEGRVVGGRPAECNIRIRGRLIPYCGCEVSLKVFGKVIPELMLAFNWRKFPRASPASGMVAYRSGHVFLIQSVIDSSTVVAYDPNSGGQKTRVHTVSLRGFHVVDPHGSRVAMN